MKNPVLSSEKVPDISENADAFQIIDALMKKLDEKDETTCQVLHEDGKTPQSKSYIWV